MGITKVHIKKHQEGRVSSGHPWVFNNEIEENLSIYEPGERVEILDSRGNFLGKGYINPHSLISARILTRDEGEEIDVPFFVKRFETAHSLRRLLYPNSDSYRVVFSEGDLLPGLIIDRYRDNFVLQIHTLGMERMKDLILEAVDTYFHPKVIIFRNDSSIREVEGMPREKGVVKGDLSGSVIFEEKGYRFCADLLNGQKTGFFFDQRENREFAGRISGGMRVLDLYCNNGAWAIHSAGGGGQGGDRCRLFETVCRPRQ